MYGGIDKQNISDDIINKEDLEKTEITGEDIDLTPDMSRVWGGVLKTLRESGETMLYAACSEIKNQNIAYNLDTIDIKIKDDYLYNLIIKNKSKIDKIAGVGVVNIYKQKDVITNKTKIIDGLKQLFGGKLTIVNK